MFRFLMGVAKFALSAWVGAASLFVVTSIQEVRAPELDSFVRDVLVTIRFPTYYAFGFTLVGLAFVAAFFAGCSAHSTRRRCFAIAGIVFLALLMMVADYVWVYQTLLKMITPPGQSRPAEFLTYHTASKWLNLASLSFCLLAAIIPCGPKFDNPPKN